MYRVLVSIAVMAGLTACTAANATGLDDDWALSAVAAPENCEPVAADEPLQPRIDATRDGGALCLAAGNYRGPITIGRGIVVFGGLDARIVSSGVGTTVHLQGTGSALLGVTIDGSGSRYDTSDAAVLLGGDDLRVESVQIVNAIFGILVEKSRRAVLVGNDIRGIGGDALGMRGDSIRLWETRDSRVERNHVRDGRDVVVWYSSDNVLANNVVRNSRYGTHFMYSHRNHVDGNRYLGNVVGTFVMYSRDITFTHNVIAGSLGAAGVGIGLKESGNLNVTDNIFVRNTSGIYLETSPLQQTDHNLWARNQFRLSGTAIVFHSSPHGNTFEDNDLIDNSALAVVEGGGDALSVAWRRNHYDNYAGFDLDGDGVGDLPFELRSLSADIESRYPNLAFFHGTPALALVELAGRALPLLTPTTVLVDPTPRMYAMGATHAP